MLLIQKLKMRVLKVNGRNGKILCFTKTGFKIKLSYRIIDFYLGSIYNQIVIYLKYVHDSFRNAKLILCLNILGFYFYILGIEKIKFPYYCNLTFFFQKKNGIAAQFKDCKEGDLISNFSFYTNSYSQIARSAGESAQLVKTSFLDLYAVVKLRTGKRLFLVNTNFCMVGIICNSFFYNLIIGKAGFRAKRGLKANVRGVAMNPIDHPNGGRTSGGKVYRSFSFRIARDCKSTKFSHSKYFVSKMVK